MNNGIKKLALFFLVCFTMGNLTACQIFDTADPKQSLEKETTLVPATEEETPAAGWGEVEQNELFRFYQDMDMRWLERMNRSMERYFYYVEFQEDFLVKDPNYHNYSISKYDVANANTLYQLLLTKDEPDELDASFVALYPSMTDLMMIINQIYDYTDLKSYLDDDYKKGKEYHQVLWGTYEEYNQYVGEFQKQFSDYRTRRLDEQQQLAKQQGQTSAYEAASVLKGAKELLEETERQGLTDENILNMDVDAIQPLYEGFLTHVNAILEVPDDPGILTTGGVENPNYWVDYIDAVKDTKTSMTLILQAVKEKKKISSPSSNTGHGSLKSYKEGLKSMFTQYERLIKLQ